MYFYFVSTCLRGLIDCFNSDKTWLDKFTVIVLILTNSTHFTHSEEAGITNICSLPNNKIEKIELHKNKSTDRNIGTILSQVQNVKFTAQPMKNICRVA